MAVLAHPITIAGVAATTVLLSERKREPAIRLGVALPLAVGVSKIVKRAFPRHKPRLLTITPRESLPSGHSVATAAYAASVVDHWRWAPLALGAIAFINSCRVRDREHRVSEVLLGDAIGLAGAAAGALIARYASRDSATSIVTTRRTAGV